MIHTRFNSRNPYFLGPPILPPLFTSSTSLLMVAGWPQTIIVSAVVYDGSTPVYAVDYVTPGAKATLIGNILILEVPGNSSLIGEVFFVTIGISDSSGNYTIADIAVTVLPPGTNDTSTSRVLITEHSHPASITFGPDNIDWRVLGARDDGVEEVNNVVVKSTGGHIQSLVPRTGTVLGNASNQEWPKISWSGGSPSAFAARSNTHRVSTIWARGRTENQYGYTVTALSDSTIRSLWIYFQGKRANPNPNPTLAAVMIEATVQETGTYEAVTSTRRVAFPSSTDSYYAIEIQYSSPVVSSLEVVIRHDEPTGVFAPRAFAIQSSAVAGWDGPLEIYEHELLERVYTLENAASDSTLEIVGLPSDAMFINEAPGVGRLLLRAVNPNEELSPFANLQMISRTAGEIVAQTVHSVFVRPARALPPSFPTGLLWNPVPGQNNPLVVSVTINPGGSTASIWADNLPPTATLVSSGANQVTLNWNPSVGDVGSFDLILWAEDQEGRLSSVALPVTVVSTGGTTLTYVEESGTALASNLSNRGDYDWAFFGYENKNDVVRKGNSPPATRITAVFNAPDWYARQVADERIQSVGWSNGTPVSGESALRRGLQASTSPAASITFTVPVPVPASGKAHRTSVLFTLAADSQCTLTASVGDVAPTITRLPAQLPSGWTQYRANFISTTQSPRTLTVTLSKAANTGGIVISGITSGFIDQ